MVAVLEWKVKLSLCLLLRQKAAYDSKNCSESCLRYWKLLWKPVMACTLYTTVYNAENWPMREKEGWNKTFDAVFRTNFRYSKCFLKSKQKRCNYFSLWKDSIKIQSMNLMRMYRKYILIKFYRPSKKFYLMTQSL